MCECLGLYKNTRTNVEQRAAGHECVYLGIEQAGGDDWN